MKKSITFKIFTITSILLIASAICIYLIIYFMLPIYYYNYKRNNVETGLTKLASTVQSLSMEESKKYFDEFNLKYTVSLNVQDMKGNIIYPPLNIISFGISQDTDIPKDSLPLPDKTLLWGSVTSTMSKEVISLVPKQIKFSEDNESYTINVIIPLQPIDEASKVLLNLVPLIGIVVIIISVVGSFIYSKKITKPLVEINKNAIQLAALDFEKSCEVNSEDEIGEIALSLNELASNLQHTMDELKNTNLKLLGDIEKEREIERKRREFTATISHELKTPITIIKGQLEGMLGNIGVYKDRDKYMNRSLVVLDDMESMVREILEISKLETHGFKPQYTEINLSYLISNCLEKLSYLISQKDISLNTKIAEELCFQGDEKLIKKAIANIINNSITHTERNEKVLINLYEDNYLIVLTVENEGVHIDEAEFEKIFNPFYRIEKSRSRSTGGSGLGLYIVKKILEAHALEYKFNNTQAGVCFKIIFNRSN
ncbi:HAMP domain-containing sensor histidine kinase [Clostridium sp. CF011]|uniref:HAMP domain-containing sensor histidine kinase n=1 Tax=Clostridium sp. CF011 TaxID=2843318 RepID=UPI00209AF4FB|nr:HAMP domain-containing sensor histidine kinase [Clostridium sp. CF011]WAG69533.1 HAMP domain-containing histidine kinase [Clostridium sp. CF011]